MEKTETKKEKSGCYKCPDRTPGCHGSCERYLAWKKELQERQAQMYREKMRGDAADGVIADGFRKRKQEWRKRLKP